MRNRDDGSSEPTADRRAFLAAGLGTLLTGFAGCTDSGGGAATPTAKNGSAPRTTPSTATTAPTFDHWPRVLDLFETLRTS